jgi:hypothetical protein
VDLLSCCCLLLPAVERLCGSSGLVLNLKRLCASMVRCGLLLPAVERLGGSVAWCSN